MFRDKRASGRKMSFLLVIIVWLIPHPIVSATSTGSNSYAQDYNVEGEKLLFEEKYSEALLLFEKALESEPDDIRALGNMSIAYIKLGKYDEAENSAWKIPKLTTGKTAIAAAYYNIGLANEGLGDMARAIKYFSLSLQNRKSTIVESRVKKISEELSKQVQPRANSCNVELVGREALGPAHDVCVVGRYAYLCTGSAVVVLDVSKPLKPKEVGRVTTFGIAKGIHVIGEYAYIADGSAGLSVINISDPANPYQVGLCDTPGSAEGVYVCGDYTYVADGDMGGLRVIEVADPRNPREVGFLYTPWDAEDVHVSGSYAYLADGYGGLRVIDISKPENPYEVGFHHESAYQVFIVGHYAYVIGLGLRVLDVSNPGSIQEVGFYEDIGLRSVYVDGKYAYMSYTGGSGLYGGLGVIDISDPENIKEEEMDMYEFGDMFWPGSVYVADGYVYVTETSGLYIMPVSKQLIPLSPQESVSVEPYKVGFYYIPGHASRIHVTGSYAYLADRGYGGMRVIDVSDPKRPREVGRCSRTEYAYDIGVYVSGKYAYEVDVSRYGYSGICIIDISNPENPIKVGSYDFFVPLWSVENSAIYVSGNHIYFAKPDGDGNSGLSVIDASNPKEPRMVGLYDAPKRAVGVRVAGKYAYVADEDAGLRVVDISKPENPREVGIYNTANGALNVFVDGSLVYIIDRESNLRIIDVSRPEKPYEVSVYEVGIHKIPAGNGLGVYVDGKYAYVAGKSGLRVIDVSDSKKPHEVGFYNTPSTASGVYVSGGYVYVVDSEGGLYILKYRNGA